MVNITFDVVNIWGNEQVIKWTVVNWVVNGMAN